MSPFKYVCLLKPFKGSNHPLLFICYEAIWLTIDLYEGLKNPSKRLCSFQRRDADSERNNMVEAIDTCEYANCILMVIFSSLLNNIVGQVVTNCLAIESK